ncbi:MAG: type II toxin-antitoxin system RelE/ParE family toxin [Magnetococcales bacterium]|nr:type II toxin-antitoxin system RelE/ParE family toxin [Magnetococcales bacterium]MBF0114972.1 type II toxin-antitoxin system RelE/ParE family toxin [Magnetococcales bacterium]
MTYSVFWDAVAKRQVQRLDRAVQARIFEKVIDLESTPRPPGAKKIRGTTDMWRIRTGDYRIIYTIEDDRLVVLVVKIGHRREVYR